MKKTIVIQIIIIMLILINTVSYATIGVTVEALEESLIYIFSKDIEINGEFENGTSKTTIEAMQVEIDDSKIVVTEEGAESFEPINYVIEDNICKFEHKYTLNISEDSSEEEALQEVMMIVMQYSMIEKCYLATADVTGKDLSLAYTYYQQKSTENSVENEESVSVDDEVFKMEIVVSETEKEYTTYLEVDLQKMAELSESDIDSSTKYTVTVDGVNGDDTQDETQDEIQDEIQDETQDVVQDEEQDDEQVIVLDEEQEGITIIVPDDEQTSTQKNNQNDETASSTKLPTAGSKSVIYLIGSVVIISAILYFKSKKYEDIK